MNEALLGLAALTLAIGVACALVIAARQGRVNVQGDINLSAHMGLPRTIGVDRGAAEAERPATPGDVRSDREP